MSGMSLSEAAASEQTKLLLPSIFLCSWRYVCES